MSVQASQKIYIVQNSTATTTGLGMLAERFSSKTICYLTTNVAHLVQSDVTYFRLISSICPRDPCLYY